MEQISLRAVISQKQKLSPEQQAALVELFGNRCLRRTKEQLARVLRWVPDMDNRGIYGRVLIEPRVSYCAGQSYPDEIRTVRDLLLGR